jgi:hypothetical protein
MDSSRGVKQRSKVILFHVYNLLVVLLLEVYYYNNIYDSTVAIVTAAFLRGTTVVMHTVFSNQGQNKLQYCDVFHALHDV